MESNEDDEKLGQRLCMFNCFGIGQRITPQEYYMWHIDRLRQSLDITVNDDEVQLVVTSYADESDQIMLMLAALAWISISFYREHH